MIHSIIVFVLLLSSFSIEAYLTNHGHLNIRYSTFLNRKTLLKQSNSGTFNVNVEKAKILEPFGKGLMGDIKRKLPYYISDFTDGFNIKSLSTSFFMFFACLAPAVAFGGLLGSVTGGQIGTIEAIGATAIGGILYSLFSAQPLTIIGTTGPLLAFLKVLYEGCAYRNIPFLPVYAWVGIWSSFFLYLSSFFSTSNLVEYFTKFTDDIFSSLISLIFIFEAIRDLVGNFMNPNVSGLQACTSLIVAFTTFFSINLLSGLRKTNLLNRKVRDKLSDFAPTLGVISGIFISRILSKRYDIILPMLKVPEVISTTSGRKWLINIFEISNPLKILCILPALMATVLLFMDQNITVRLVMSKDNLLKKGSGLHLDMFVVSLVTTITSLLGMPWMVAATVRSLAHLKSLRIYSIQNDDVIPVISDTDANLKVETAVKEVSNENKVEVIGVQEQRVTGLTIHTLIGAAILTSRNLLRQIPSSVLTGLFLYLGFSSISTTELFERSKLFVMDKRDIPATFKWKNVISLNRVKIFTAIQLFLLGSMWWLKSTRFGVFFPVLIGVLAPIRILLEKKGYFSRKEMEILDEPL